MHEFDGMDEGTASKAHLDYLSDFIAEQLDGGTYYEVLIKEMECNRMTDSNGITTGKLQ